MKKGFSTRLVMASLLLHGCGPARPLPPVDKTPTPQPQVKLEAGTPSPSPGLAESLGIRVFSEASPVQGGQDFRRPDPTFSLDSQSTFDLSVKMSGNQISYSQIFYLPEPNSPDLAKRKTLFFVWPDRFLGSPILQATIIHRILDGNNRWIGALASTPAWHDPERHQWFVPITQLFQELGDEYGSHINQADTQVTTLELILAAPSKVVIEIRFRASGLKPLT